MRRFIMVTLVIAAFRCKRSGDGERVDQVAGEVQQLQMR